MIKIILYIYSRNNHPKTSTPFVMDTASDQSVHDDLRDLLKRCPAGTFEAAIAFRARAKDKKQKKG